MVAPVVVFIFAFGLIGTYVNDEQWRCGKTNSRVMPFDIYMSKQDTTDVNQLVKLRDSVFSVIVHGNIRGDSLEKLNRFKRQYDSIARWYQDDRLIAFNKSIRGLRNGKPANLVLPAALANQQASLYKERKSATDNQCSFGKVWSFYTFISIITSLLAVSVVAYLFSSVIILGVQRRLGKNVPTAGIITTVAIIAPWIILRSYSDLYINFLENINAGVYIFMIVLFIFILIVFIMDKPAPQVEKLNTIYSAFIGLAALITGISGLYKQPFLFVYNLSGWLKCLLFIIIICPLILLAIDQMLQSTIKKKRDEERGRLPPWMDL